MSFYSKHILPRYLNLTMAGSGMETDRQEVSSKASGTVLEIGFGSGLNLPHYVSVIKLYALDPSKELFDLAEERIKAASFPIEHLLASAEHIPLPDSSMDAVVSTWTLCSIPHPEAALKEVFRVLKPRGIFRFVEHGKSPKGLTFKIQTFLTPLSKRFAGGCHMDRDIEKLIKDSGFEFERLDKLETRSKPLAFMYKGAAIARKYPSA